MKKFLFVAIIAAGTMVACNDSSSTNNGVDTSSQTYKDSVAAANGTGGSMMGTGTDTTTGGSMMGTGTDTTGTGSGTMSSDSGSTMMSSDSSK